MGARVSLLARISLANRGLVALITIAILGVGAAVLPQLRQQMFPDLQFPQISVLTAYPGASPELVEQQVTIPVEQAVAGVDGVTLVTSTSRAGASAVSVSFDYGADVKQISADIEAALGRLNLDVDPRVIAGTTDDIPVIALAASGVSDDVLRQRVLPEIGGIDGVREATLSGNRTKQVVVNLDRAQMAARGITVQALTSALTANGVSTPGGMIIDDDRSYSVAVGGRLTSLEQLGELYLNPTTRLRDIARLEAAEAEPTTLTRTNGKPSVGITVTAVPGANAVAISHEVSDLLPGLESSTGADLEIIFDQAPEVERSIHSLTTEGLLGLTFAVLVILLFLLSVRSTLVTAVSIPVSVVIALIALWSADYSLNMLTLGGLTIAIGRVVDDSIVVLENIKRHLALGAVDKRASILTAVREVAGAVTASTLTTVAVFLPIALVGGLVGQFFGPFGLTVTAALLASLVVSLTIVPVLAYWFLKPPSIPRPAEASADGKLQRAYVPLLRWSLRFRWTTLLLAAFIMVGTTVLATRIETSFIGGSGTTLSINQELPVGTSLAATDEASQRIEQILAETDEVDSYQVTVGSGGQMLRGGGNPTTNRATYRVTIASDAVLSDVTARLRERVDALGSSMGSVDIGSAGGAVGSSDLAVEVQAADDSALRAAAEQVRAAVSALDGVQDVRTDLATSAPQVQVTLDRTAAAARGMTDSSVGQLVSAAFRGIQITRVVVDGVEQPVILRTGAAPTDVAALRSLPLAPGVALDDVADVAIVDGPAQIKRVDQARTATITATPTTSGLGSLNAALASALSELDLPAGASYTIGGVTQSQEEAFGDLYIAMLVAIALVFIVMIGTFRSLAQPLILLVSIPFAATGALGLLALTGEPLGLPAMIGLLMLIGIVVTNAIVLLDLINQYRATGLGVRESIVEGGRRRLRPILMTAVATIFALLPMSLGLTESSAFISQPLAVVVIGGLITSTLLTLVLVPVIYSLVEGGKARLRRKAAPPARDAELASVGA